MNTNPTWFDVDRRSYTTTYFQYFGCVGGGNTPYRQQKMNVFKSRCSWMLFYYWCFCVCTSMHSECHYHVAGSPRKQCVQNRCEWCCVSLCDCVRECVCVHQSPVCVYGIYECRLWVGHARIATRRSDTTLIIFNALVHRCTRYILEDDSRSRPFARFSTASKSRQQVWCFDERFELNLHANRIVMCACTCE